MGSIIEINDTLQITSKQGFPKKLNYEKHKIKTFKIENFKNKIFKFKNKPEIRLYQLPPNRNFLVQNIEGEWIYWGLVQIIELTHDNIKKTTSGKYKIIQIFTPEEMKVANKLIKGNN